MANISALSSKALYAKAKACYASHMTPDDYVRLSSLSSLEEFVSHLKNKTQYSAAFEGLGGSGHLTRQHVEAIIRRMFFLRLEKLVRYANLCDNYVSDYFLARHECECIVRRLRQSGEYTLDSYFVYMPEGFFTSTGFDIYALEHARSQEELLEVLHGTDYGKLLDNILKSGAGSLIAENVIYGYLFEHSAKGFKKKLEKKEYEEIERILAMFSDMITINNLYRIKKFYPDCADKLLIHVYTSNLTHISDIQLDKMKKAKDVTEFTAQLEKTCYKQAATLLRGSESALFTKQYIYNECKRLFTISDKAAVSALCYSYLITNEASNLIVLTEALSAGVSQERMLKLLVT